MFKKFSISGINALPRFGLVNSSNILTESIRPISKSISLYVHIPYCKSICHFCMLRRGAKAVDSVPQIYIDNIIKDIELHKINLQGINVNSIYFGGGTPSMMSAAQFETLLKAIFNTYSVSTDVEITFEGEPQSLLNKELLSTLNNNNVNRISFGLQTFDKHLRDLLGRTDSINDISNLFEMLSKYSFKEINIDYLYNLPNTDVQFIENEFNLIKSLNPSSIDCHPLKYISCSGHLLQNIVDNNMNIPSSELRINMFNYIRNYLLSNNFKEQFADQYSIYSKTDTNQYMRNLYGLDGGEYLGIGPGSRSHFGDYGFTKVQNLDNYFLEVTKGSFPIQRITYAPLIDNYITCFPKRNDNLLYNEIEESASSDFFFNQLNMLCEEGYVFKNEKSYSLTSLGISWYQNLQELLLSPTQRSKHLENVNARKQKFEKFGNYFENLGEVL